MHFVGKFGIIQVLTGRGTEMPHYREKGNVLGFVIVGIVLAALVVGGILVARNFFGGNEGEVVAPEETSQQAEGNSESTPTETDEELAEALKNQAAAEEKAKEQQAANDKEAASATTPTASTSPTTTERLPATGPEEAIAPLVGAVLLAGIGVSYVRSRSLI